MTIDRRVQNWWHSYHQVLTVYIKKDKDCTSVGYIGRAYTAYHNQITLLLHTVFLKTYVKKGWYICCVFRFSEWQTWEGGSRLKFPSSNPLFSVEWHIFPLPLALHSCCTGFCPAIWPYLPGSVTLSPERLGVLCQTDCLLDMGRGSSTHSAEGPKRFYARDCYFGS